MRSLILAVLIVVMLPLAAAAQASNKDIAVPWSHPAADLTSYDKYENAMDESALAADRYAAQQKSLKEWLPVAAAAQASDKNIVVPWSHPAADLTSYAKYENVLDGIEAYQAGLLKLRSAAEQEDIRSR